jgi:dTDP-4-dehydrorhamnose reductase
MSTSSRRRVLLTGATGRLGNYVLRELVSRGLTVTAWGGREGTVSFGVRVHPVDLVDADATAAAFRAVNPEVVIHTAAVSAIEDCERDPVRAGRINADATERLAALAAGARFILTSTDLVFDGERGWYREADVANPLSVYGRTKRAAEGHALAVPRGVVIRMSLLYGPALTNRSSFFDHMLAALRGGQSLKLFTDEWRTPLAFPAAAAGLVGVALSDFGGLLHLGGPERLSRLEMGQRLVRFLGCEPGLIVPTTRAEAGLAGVRPRDTSLDSALWRGWFPDPLPGWEEALTRMGIG